MANHIETLPGADGDALRLALRAALAGAAATMATGATGTRHKADRSPVTEADLASDRAIAKVLSADARPVVSEESDRSLDRTEGTFWLIDPLDGTKEFIRGGDDFTTNVALVRNGMPVLGVVVRPATGAVFAGAMDGGAWRGTDGELHPITVRMPGDDPVCVATRSHRNPATDAFLRAHGLERVESIGSSLKFCLVADGTGDLYPRLGPIMPWDTAAGHAVVLGAGGTVVTVGGGPLRYDRGMVLHDDFVACHPDLLPRLDLTLLKTRD